MAAENTDNEEIIRSDDFKSIEMNISIVNTTTKTQIKNGMRIYGQTQESVDEDLSIKLIEFQEREMVLEAPANACAEGHNLIVNIVASAPSTAENNGGIIEFSATAKVRLVEMPSKTRHSVTVTLIQYDESSYKSFCSLFSNRQQEIEAFFNAVKGF
ncbi:MAG: hypothetical protein A3K03_06020 [Bdellovibrionales bacterium RIFOXYD1_FULL_44_7]|nr:MAG: hypothetical protein A3K03_06020 [Bdellovibrionales bacterium RIFOXYD1_FULL_44_7]